jgi:alkylhydroperoxidase/carboxymuconolactone decarboxylase family protein
MHYEDGDLAKFPEITEWQKPLGDAFFSYYGKVFEKGELTQREKSLIALAVAHAVQCPYCIEAYTSDCLEKGATEGMMMEATHVACAIKGGAVLAHGVQMMKHAKKVTL